MVKDLDKFDMILQAYEYEQGTLEAYVSVGKGRQLNAYVLLLRGMQNGSFARIL